MISLPEHLECLGLPAAASEATRRAVHAAHARAMPFENLDIPPGQPISGEVAAIFVKLIRPGGAQTYRVADEAEYRPVRAAEFDIELTAAEQLRPRLAAQ
ncbi:arylamine N-acetyltransferase [Hymenobacter edaphi]|uniref:Uncharacterized protein n=1 Tax=Hymenobacter edaphi TaxID=2211146 RepID=A0A328BGS5_9BACT|nr:arylamine N-acetyltransferase [Hymenobacter edaphi]RAK65835.1 hypothetical protein DLM85_14045 [Hymenobacter edaphi]